MRHRLSSLAAGFAVLVLVPAALYACGDDDDDGGSTSTVDSGSDTATSAPDGGGKDASVADSSKADTSTPDTSMPDTSTVVAVRCTQAEFDAVAGPNGGDHTGTGGVDISFPFTPTPAQYTQRCAKVKVGSSVTFAGSFANHPLEANGGDKPSPIASTNTGAVLTFTVPNAGTFGYQCAFHPGSMFGAIQVVP